METCADAGLTGQPPRGDDCQATIRPTHDLPYFPALLDDAGLDPYEIRVFLRICRRSNNGRATAKAPGECSESIANMAVGCRISPSTLKRALGRLRKRRMVEEAGPRKRQTDRLRLRPAPPELWFLGSARTHLKGAPDPRMGPLEPSIGSARPTKDIKEKAPRQGEKIEGRGVHGASRMTGAPSLTDPDELALVALHAKLFPMAEQSSGCVAALRWALECYDASRIAHGLRGASADVAEHGEIEVLGTRNNGEPYNRLCDLLRPSYFTRLECWAKGMSWFDIKAKHDADAAA